MDNERQLLALTRAIRAGQLKPENSGGYWTIEEREALRDAYSTGIGITEMALMFGRTEMAVFQQIIVMGLANPYGPKRSSSTPVGPHCLCSKCKYEECPIKERYREVSRDAGTV